MNLTEKITLCSVILLLTACGGGSDNGDVTKTVSSSNAAPVPISSSNMEQASTIALNSVFNNFALAASETFTGVLIEQSPRQFNINDTEWLFEHLNKGLHLRDNFTGVVTAQTYDCSISGNVEMKIDVQNVSTISVNDSMTFTFNNCNDGDGITNGSFSLTFTQLNDFISLDNFEVLGMDVSFNNFAFKPSDNSDEVEILGEYSIIITQDLYSQDTDIMSDRISIIIPDYKQAIEDIIIKKVFTNNTNTETLTVSNTIIDDVLGGSLTVTTLEELVFIGRSTNSPSPSSGVIKVKGANSSSIIITVLDSTSVQLDADFDGNNTIDSSIITSWQDLTF